VQQTEVGSRSSENSQLAGSLSVAKDHIVQEFCIKSQGNDDEDDDGMYFMQGKIEHQLQLVFRVVQLLASC